MSLSLGMLGTYHPFLWLVWFQSRLLFALDLQGIPQSAVIAAINTLMAGAAGGVSAMTYAWFLSYSRSKKPDPGLSVNGISWLAWSPSLPRVLLG